MAGVAGREQDTVEDGGWVHRAFVPSDDRGWAMAAILTLLKHPMPLHVVIAHPGAVNGKHLFPARGPCELRVGHTPDNIEVCLDQILPGLSRFYALFVDRERGIHVHCLAAVKNGPTVTDERFGHPKGRERCKEHF